MFITPPPLKAFFSAPVRRFLTGFALLKFAKILAGQSYWKVFRNQHKMRGRRGEKADINFGKIDDNFHQEAFLNFELEKFYGWMSEVYNSGSLVMRGVACSLSFFLANLKFPWWRYCVLYWRVWPLKCVEGVITHSKDWASRLSDTGQTELIF